MMTFTTSRQRATVQVIAQKPSPNATRKLKLAGCIDVSLRKAQVYATVHAVDTSRLLISPASENVPHNSCLAFISESGTALWKTQLVSPLSLGCGSFCGP